MGQESRNLPCHPETVRGKSTLLSKPEKDIGLTPTTPKYCLWFVRVSPRSRMSAGCDGEQRKRWEGAWGDGFWKEVHHCTVLELLPSPMAARSYLCRNPVGRWQAAVTVAPMPFVAASREWECTSGVFCPNSLRNQEFASRLKSKLNRFGRFGITFGIQSEKLRSVIIRTNNKTQIGTTKMKEREKKEINERSAIVKNKTKSSNANAVVRAWEVLGTKE